MLVIPLALALPAAAADDGQGQSPKDEGITRQQADEILNELRQIRQLLGTKSRGTGQPDAEQPLRAKLNLKGFQMLGDKKAPLTMVEFTDCR